MNQLEHNRIVGKRITEIRRKRGLTRKELAFKIPLSVFELVYIEKGMLKAETKTMCLIADSLQISISDLMWVD